MKTNFVKLIGIALLCVATFITTGCSKDDDNLSTQTVEGLITILAEIGVWDSDSDWLIDDATGFYIILEEDESEEDVIEFLESIVAGSFDTSGEKVTLADGSSYVNIVKSGVEGEFYIVTFSLSGYEKFKMIAVMNEYLNNDNFLF
ncbi:MAG: hypothetical protein SNJ33_07890 [Rikenellaceae bacterium]